MIITIGGKPGSGKSTVARKVAEKLGMKYYSVGDLMGRLAQERGMSILEFSKLAEKDKRIDRLLDDAQINLAREDNFVIDSRLGFHFIPNSVKVFLDVDEEEGARRILQSVKNAERPDEAYLKNIAESMESTRKRVASEKKRYLEYYNVDPYDLSNYDLLIDTTQMPVEEVVDAVVRYVADLKAAKEKSEEGKK
ncbi:cytidylate kinase [Candidatus Woesearchaeota archaeon]|nr:MAG: cytidylate kinase [Candidatus Woesearchaeota archaeon]